MTLPTDLALRYANPNPKYRELGIYLLSYLSSTGNVCKHSNNRRKWACEYCIGFEKTLMVIANKNKYQ